MLLVTVNLKLSMCALSTIRESRSLTPLMPATDGGEWSGGLLYVSAALREGQSTRWAVYYNFAKGMEFFCFSSVLGIELEYSHLK